MSSLIQQLFHFMPLTESDLDKIKNWLKEPHVKEFYDSNKSWDDVSHKIKQRISSDLVKQFIIYYNNSPIGFIQFYWANKVGSGWWENYPDDVIGIDQYIGEPHLLSKGIGNKMISAFINFITSQYPNIKRIIADPSLQNIRAIKCYEKVGFTNKGPVETPDGPVQLMEFININTNINTC